MSDNSFATSRAVVLSALLVMSAFAVTHAVVRAMVGGPEIVDVNDMAPYERSEVTTFWDCSRHHCRVVQAWSSGAIVEAGTGSSVEVLLDSLESRMRVRRVSDLFDFLTDKSGFLFIVR